MWPSFLQKTGSVFPKEAVWDAKNNELEVLTPHAFTQMTGYLKYTRASQGSVFYRGQRSRHGHKLVPSLFRDAESNDHIQKLNNRMSGHLATIGGNADDYFLKGTPPYAREALLQHYFIQTRYVDLVDNPWIALWFACHSVIIPDRLHGFYRRRSTADEPNGYAHVLLIQPGSVTPVAGQQGVLEGNGCELIDLRVASPSLYLRPHAQHGLLFRRKKITQVKHADYEDLVVGAITIRLDRALSWLGDGGLLTTHNLFPPAAYDKGYQVLLGSPLNSAKLIPDLGRVVSLGP